MRTLEKREFDAVVVGSGPNGLAAAITLQQAGLAVLVLEARDTIGGGMRTAELTLPGFKHDVCSAIHPLGAGSPFFKTLPLHQHGLQYIYPPVAAAHPFDDGAAALLHPSLAATAATLGPDGKAYQRLLAPLVAAWPQIGPLVLGPLKVSPRLLRLTRFGTLALLPAQTLVNWQFRGKEAKGLFAGMAAHSLLSLAQVATSAIGLVLSILGHQRGWPLPRGGSQQIADALAGYFTALGGKIETGFPVRSLGQLPSAHAVLFDVTPRQLLQIAGHRFSSLYGAQLRRYRYGFGVFVQGGLRAGRPRSGPEGAGRRTRCTWAIRWPRLPGVKEKLRRARTRNAPSCCWPSRACSTRRGRRPAGTRPGPTATCPTVLPAT